ncbi:hypothetical protein MASR1M90_02780 [Desulfovibrionales bacterium]
MRQALCVLCFFLVWASSVFGYDYPFTDPFVATVFGTQPKDEFALRSVRSTGLADLNPLQGFGAQHVREMLVYDRPVPDVLWYNDTLQYAKIAHQGPAPLLFVLAGTGASYAAENCRFLQAIFYRAGFHVVCLSSPTYSNFVVSASATQVPGYIPNDVADLYRCMNLLADQIGRERITAMHVVGYSLGGTQAAFVRELDAREKRLGLRKTLLINPAVSVLRSALSLDSLLEDNVNSKEEAAEVIAGLVHRLSDAYRDRTAVNFGDDFLYALQKVHPLTERELKILIGVAFRLSLASMVFSSDVCTGAGYIVPRGHQVLKDESLDPYLDASVEISFADYAREYLIPFVRFQRPDLSADDIVQACSLEAIAPFLRDTPDVAVMTNQDDFILSPDDFLFLRQTFGSRLTLYPVGGHCGNLRYRDNVAAMLAFFQQKG